MRAPAVSVIIPTRDRSEMVVRAIRSVLAQDFQNYEIVVVDDGSRDETNAAVSMLADPRIILVAHKVPKGGSAARNTGIRASSGPVIAFLDSDDEWCPSKLSRQLPLFADPSVGAVFSEYDIANSGVVRSGPEIRFADEPPTFERLLSGWCPSMTSVCLVRREHIAQAGGFDEELQGYQDYDLWLRLAQVARFSVVPERLATVHTHEQDRVSITLETRQAALELIMTKWSSTMDAVVGPGTSEKVFAEMASVNMLSIVAQAAKSGERLKAFDLYSDYLRLAGVRSGIRNWPLFLRVVLPDRWYRAGLNSRGRLQRRLGEKHS